MRVGLIRFHGSSRPPTSACDHMKLQRFFERAGLALCCGHRGVGRDMRIGLLLVRPHNGGHGVPPQEEFLVSQTNTKDRSI